MIKKQLLSRAIMCT